MKYIKHLLVVLGGLVAYIFLAHSASAQEPVVIQLQETIRGNQEQPKVLTIVPWQSPKAKQPLPSPIIERINKKFVPLQREELKLQIAMLNNKNIPQP